MGLLNKATPITLAKDERQLSCEVENLLEAKLRVIQRYFDRTCHLRGVQYTRYMHTCDVSTQLLYCNQLFIRLRIPLQCYHGRYRARVRHYSRSRPT